MSAPLLLVDIGNTRLKWADVTPRGAIVVRGHVPTARVTPRWMAAWAKKQEGRRIVVASVVPEKSRLLRRHAKKALFVNGARRGLPLAFDYPRPAELGADRIAAAVGAGASAGGAKSRGPVIVISCGTATAFSVLDRRGRFRGGLIAPGVEAQLRALAGATAQLPALAPRPAGRALGRSTRSAMQAGILLQFQGGVREIITRLRREIGGSARVVVTGGQARQVRAMRGLGRIEFRPLLVFEGLRIIADSIPQP